MNKLEDEIKEIIINSLNLEDMDKDDIETDGDLFGDGLGLDSIDALELGIAIQKKYDVKFDQNSDKTRESFRSVKTLAKYISEKK